MPDQSTALTTDVARTIRGQDVLYVGTADALIVAGILTATMLPGAAGNSRGLCAFDASGRAEKPSRAYTRRCVGDKVVVAVRSGNGLLEVRMRLGQCRADAIADEAAARASAWPFPKVYGRIPGARAQRQRGLAGAPA